MKRRKVLAVTGGAQGIGRAIAEHFAAHGYAVSIADTHVAAGRAVLKALLNKGAHAAFFRADISQEQDVRNWLRATARTLGCPDVLVNNAGIRASAPFLTLSPKAFDLVLGTNLRGTFLCTQEAARLMVKHKVAGAIINIASTRAFMSEPGTEAYSASKGGIVALTHATAISLGPKRIRVNSISPGWIETRGRKHSRRDRLQHPVGRVGTPEDVASACRYLAEHAGFMTGQNLTLDGGMTVKMIYEE
ncbi:MAG: SDR family oxidoreductase [Betaproteobacteria bacterium]|nr:SDR family oxidoreductase [Betaproteobacteria bacterium]MDH5222978.1 SDR family oxidoreductase [Betaproteobacteria bacterium]MDH5349759.1 SDR family oxidoreductase [Betaproteobacteria bacterium]